MRRTNAKSLFINFEARYFCCAVVNLPMNLKADSLDAPFSKTSRSPLLTSRAKPIDVVVLHMQAKSCRKRNRVHEAPKTFEMVDHEGGFSVFSWVFFFFPVLCIPYLCTFCRVRGIGIPSLPWPTRFSTRYLCKCNDVCSASNPTQILDLPRKKTMYRWRWRPRFVSKYTNLQGHAISTMPMRASKRCHGTEGARHWSSTIRQFSELVKRYVSSEKVRSVRAVEILQAQKVSSPT